MKKILRLAFRSALGTAAGTIGAIGMVGCDASPPPDAVVSRPVEPEAISAGETLTDVVREALADVVRDEDAFSRARRLGALLPTLAPEHVAAVQDTLEDATLDFGATELDLLLRFWATHQPEDASRWVVAYAPAGYRVPAVYSTLPLWAEADPQAAALAAGQWSRQPDISQAVKIALVRGWHAGNPSEAAQFVHDLGMGVARQRSIAAYVRAMAQTQGLEALGRWAESLPDADAVYKTAVYRQVAAVLALFDHEASIRWCEAHCEGPFGNSVRSIIARVWVRTDGAAALEWLSTAPEGHDSRLAVRKTFSIWGQLDREAALAWMADQTTGEPAAWLEPTFPVYARFLAPSSPAAAIEWAERIARDEDREFTLIAVARLWRRMDAEAAEAWLLQSPLSEEAREKVRDPAPGPVRPDVAPPRPDVVPPQTDRGTAG